MRKKKTPEIAAAEKNSVGKAKAKGKGACARTPQMEAMSLLLLTTRLHHSEIERRIASMGIHHSQHRMLMLIARSDETNSQRELAEAMNISPAAVTATLKALEKAGCVERNMSEGDNRRNTVRITEEGLRTVAESRRMFDAMDQAALKGFSEQEIAELTGLLRRIADNLLVATGKADAESPEGENPEEEIPAE